MLRCRDPGHARALHGQFSADQRVHLPHPGHSPISLLGDTIRLSYAENPGGFLSLGADLPGWIRSWAFGVLALVAVLAVLIVAIRHHSLDRLQAIAVSLLIAGGVGNIIDR